MNAERPFIQLSLIYPKGPLPDLKQLSDETVHDLGLDDLSTKLSAKDAEQGMLRSYLSRIPSDPEVIRYRTEVYRDIASDKKLRETLTSLLGKIDFLKSYGGFRRDSDASGMWDLMHRLDSLSDYCTAIEEIYRCLDAANISSKGLLALKEYTGSLYFDKGFQDLKKDIDSLGALTSNIKSVTIGINLNRRMEAEGVGIISVNSKTFSKSGIISNFSNFLDGKGVKEGNEWNGRMSFQPVANDSLLQAAVNADRLGANAAAAQNPMMARTVVNFGDGEWDRDVVHGMDKTISQMLSGVAKKLKDVLSRHVSVSIYEMANLIPELMYYVRFAEYAEQITATGMKLCTPEVSDRPETERLMEAEGIYNIRLAYSRIEKLAEGVPESELETIITNDVTFDSDHRIYILTGANRGGKTTITQAIGLAFVLAEAGFSVPGTAFRFHPVDAIFTHYPADEDKTMDLGRLGEECKRFKAIFTEATEKSLLLLNETFSTTSFEEGYYIAYDAIRAMRKKGVRVIYNTHMHKLARELDALNAEPGDGKVASLVSETNDGIRSYKLKVAPPEGMSYAGDIAKRYGVTYEQLSEE